MNQHQKIILGIGAIVLAALLMLHNPISGYVKTERAPEQTNDGALAASIYVCRHFPEKPIDYKDYYCDTDTRSLVKDVGILEYKSTSPALPWLASLGNILNMILGVSFLLAFLYFIAKPAQSSKS